MVTSMTRTFSERNDIYLLQAHDGWSTGGVINDTPPVPLRCGHCGDIPVLHPGKGNILG